MTTYLGDKAVGIGTIKATKAVAGDVLHDETLVGNGNTEPLGVDKQVIATTNQVANLSVTLHAAIEAQAEAIAKTRNDFEIADQNIRADKVAEIQTEKMSVSIGNIIGDVSSNGTYVPSSEPYTLDLTGVKTVGDRGFQYAFYGDKNIDKVIANDVTSVGTQGFGYAFDNAPKLSRVSVDGIEEIDGNYAFYYFLYNTLSPEYTHVSFAKLKRITGDLAFSYAFGGRSITTIPPMDEIFPSLEEITGDRAFNSGFRPDAGSIITFSKIKKITGGTTTSRATITFGSSIKNVVWNFPNATEFTGYIWNLGTSYPGEIHFAAANQAAIEACEGYSYKWGMQAGTIYFDL